MSIAELLMQAAAQDTQQLLRNDAQGDTFSLPRDVEFLLVADDERKAYSVCSFVNENRYGLARVSPRGSRYNVSVILHMPIEQHLLCSVSALMVCIGQIFAVDYDGWRCSLQASGYRMAWNEGPLPGGYAA